MSQPLVESSWVYSTLRGLVAVFFRLYFGVRIRDAENLPTTGPVVLACNHQSFLDIPLVSIVTKRHVGFVARETLADSRLLGWIMRRCGAVLVKRGEADRAAVREMLKHLEAGDCVAIFPEGTRTRDGLPAEFRRGALLVARKAGVPIVPVAIAGTFEAWPRTGKFPMPRRIGVRVAPPVDSSLPDAQERVRQAVLDMVGDGRYESWSAIP